MGFHTNTTPGELIERIDGDVTAVANFLARFVVRLLGSGFLLVGVVVVSWTQNVWMGGAITVYVAFVLALMIRMRKLAVRSCGRGASGFGAVVRLCRRAPGGCR